jgi:hypothetical protein
MQTGGAPKMVPRWPGLGAKRIPAGRRRRRWRVAVRQDNASAEAPSRAQQGASNSGPSTFPEGPAEVPLFLGMPRGPWRHQRVLRALLQHC